MPASRPRLELVWPGKDQFLLTPTGDDGKPVWVEPDHPAAHEVRLTEFTDGHGEVDKADPYADNLVFTGDSLDVLRVLCEVPEYRQHYRGKVKLIYIDPPFNTGQTFAHYDDWMEHSTWLSFMRDRLLLMKQLLASDGSIWVHLDDAEVHRMRCLLDEVFGTQAFIATIIWQKRYSRENRPAVSVSHDYLLCYSLSPARWKGIRNLLPIDDKTRSQYRNPNNDPRGPWRTVAMNAMGYRPNQMYDIVAPSGNVKRPPAGSCWKYVPETYQRLLDEGRIYFGRDGDSQPSVIRYLDEVPGLVPTTWWPHEEVSNTDAAKRETQRMSGSSGAFDTPKPERLIQRVIHIASNPKDIVVDLFGGSGTTAAVAQKMGRRWLTAELSLETVAKFIVPRLTKVVDGDDPGGISKDVGWEGGGGFRTVTVGPSMYEVRGAT